MVQVSRDYERMIAIGVDIGGTKTTIGAVTTSGRILARRRFPTEPLRGFSAAVDRITDGIAEVAAEAGVPTGNLSGIGIGCTGPVNPAAGTIHNPHTLPGWEGRNVVAPLRARYGVPVVVECDADAALFGEWKFGAARGAATAIMLTFGTGVGFGGIIQGRLLRGANGAHPEPGHLFVLPDGPECYCGTRGCLESMASGTAIARAGLAAGYADGRDVFAAARNGAPAARSIIDRAAQATAAAVWSLVHAFAPEVTIFGGGIMDEHFDLFQPTVCARLTRAVMVPVHADGLVRATLGDDAGVIGAACLLM